MNKLLKLLKIIAYIAVVLLFFMMTLPKKELFYKAEEFLQTQGITIYDEQMSTGVTTLLVQNGIINYKGIDGATFKAINFNASGVFNRVEIESLKTNKAFQNIMPTSFETITLSHTLVNPFKVFIQAKSMLGELRGDVNLIKRKIYVVLEPKKALSTNEKNLLKFMKYETLPQSKQGVYVYEYNY